MEIPWWQTAAWLFDHAVQLEEGAAQASARKRRTMARLRERWDEHTFRVAVRLHRDVEYFRTGVDTTLAMAAQRERATR